MKTMSNLWVSYNLLIQNAGRKEAYWVPRGAAAEAATAMALGHSLDGNVENNLVEVISNATGDFVSNYTDMKEANTIGADKYFHCKANCQASQRGEAGEVVAEVISDVREWTDRNIKGDPASASEEDKEANHFGREKEKNNLDKGCDDICEPFRPNGLDAEY